MSTQIVINEIPSNINTSHLDQVFRVFEPLKMRITNKRQAIIIFRSSYDAEIAHSIVSLRPDLVERKLGTAKLQPMKGVLMGGGVEDTIINEFEYSLPICKTCVDEFDIGVLKFPHQQ